MRFKKYAGDWAVLSRLMGSKPLLAKDINKASLRRLQRLDWITILPRTHRVKLTRQGIYEYQRLLNRRQEIMGNQLPYRGMIGDR